MADARARFATHVQAVGMSAPTRVPLVSTRTGGTRRTFDPAHWLEHFGDFDAVRRDESAIQSRSTAMLWTREAPYVVQVSSANDNDGRPMEVTFTVADEANIHTDGAERVSHRPAGK